VLPLLFGFLALFHISFVGPLLAVTITTESTDYTCNHKGKVQLALFGTLSVYLASFLVETAIFFVGLRGGPFEEKKRRLVGPLLYVEVLLVVVTLAFTCYATWVSESPEIEATCWSSNPCAYAADTIPAACTIERDADVALTPACETVLRNGEDLERSDGCFNRWFDYFTTYVINNFNATLRPPFNPPGTVFPEPSPCNASVRVNSVEFDRWAEEAIAQVVDYVDALEAEELISEVTEEQAKRLKNLSSTLEGQALNFLGLPYTNTTAAQDAPWFDCFDADCQEILRAGDECQDWDVLLNIPSSQSRYNAFIATVFSSWAILGVTIVITVLAFNAFPDYENPESWEGTVRAFAKWCCFGNVLDNAETESGSAASEEIAGMLHQLFGAIDLDVSDQVLGMYLVSERQKWRQRQAVLSALDAAGIQPLPLPHSWLRRTMHNVGRMLRSRRFRRTSAGVPLATTLEGQSVPRGVSSNQPNDDVNVVRQDPLPQLVPASFTLLPPSPFDTPSTSNLPDKTVNKTKKMRAAAYLPSLAHSMVRLVSLRPLHDEQTADNPAASASHTNGKPQVSLPVYKTSSSATAVRTKSGVEVSSTSIMGGLEAVNDALGKALVVTNRQRPLLTPVSLQSLALRLPISARTAAEIYAAPPQGTVSSLELREMLGYSRFAQAAYGLQSVKWKGATQKHPCHPSTVLDSALACCSPLQRPLRLSSHFKKRNFKAILDIAEVAPGDVLYASYASTTYGTLPYLLVLDRSTKSVVLAIRGTVGFSDLITDLLSNPVDTSEYMPSWVLEETTTARDGASPVLLAHAGVLSSAKAVLKDLRDRGILDAAKGCMSSVDDAGSYCPLEEAGRQRMSPQQPSARDDASMNGEEHTGPNSGNHVVHEGGLNDPQRSATALQRLATLHDDDVVELDVEAARGAVHDAMARRGWRLVVTGHSLGAAVACMLSFNLRVDFPSLRCFAYCPPGGLMTAPLASLSKTFCTSVVVGRDVISRLGFPTTVQIVDDMTLALARCRRPKLAVLMDALLGRRKDPSTSPPTFCSFEDVGTDARVALQRYVETSQLHSKSTDARDLFPPGNICHLRSFVEWGKQRGSASSQETWDAVWVDGSELIAEGILLSRDMVRHHRTETLQRALRAALEAEESAPLPV
jgi:hypothetical protein